MKVKKDSLTREEKILKRKNQSIKLNTLCQGLVSSSSIPMTQKTVDRIRGCGDYFEFLADKEKKNYKLKMGIFCNHRFCSICSKNKAVKDSLCLKVLCSYLEDKFKRKFILITLTAPNVKGEFLSDEIVKYNRAFITLTKRKPYCDVFKGFVRKLEVTYNKNKKSKSYDTYHPHFHVLVSVSSSYFKGGSYIARDKLLRDWQEVMDDFSITQVDIRKVDVSKGILEVSKYIAKDSNYLENKEVFKCFYQGLRRKKSFTFGGDFKDALSLYKKGDLDSYKESFDVIDWYWLIKSKWSSYSGSYSNEEKKISDLSLGEKKDILKLLFSEEKEKNLF